MLEALVRFVSRPLSIAVSFLIPAQALAADALVKGFAREFVTFSPIKKAKVVVLETGRALETDRKGRFSFMHPVGSPVTLELRKKGYRTTQSATIVVPESGLTARNEEISFQVPFSAAYKLMKKAMGARDKKGMCHVVVTVLARGKTWHDLPHGEPGARLVVTPATEQPIFYFAAHKRGPLKHKTNPFVHTRKQTSVDGGAAIVNLEPRREPYTVTAEKQGLRFSETKIWCRPGAFINVSPPRGPSVLE
jgi:hypothetical protein